MLSPCLTARTFSISMLVTNCALIHRTIKVDAANQHVVRAPEEPRAVIYAQSTIYWKETEWFITDLRGCLLTFCLSMSVDCFVLLHDTMLL